MYRLTVRLFVAVALVLPGPRVKAQGTRPPTTLTLVSGEKIPWRVEIYPSSNVVAVGSCQAVYIDLFDASAKDIPRNLVGQRVGLANFDWVATGKRSDAAVGVYDTPNNWKVCACQAAAVGTTINITVQYPARALPPKAQMPGLAFRASIELPVIGARGTNNPKGCDALASMAVASAPLPAAVTPVQLPPAQMAPERFVPGAAAAPTLAPPTSTPIATVPPAGAAPRLSRSDVSHPVPVNPSGFAATPSGAGTVTLSWQAVPGASFYQLWGSGIQNTGVSVSGTTYTVSNVSAGDHEWTVGTFYMPGPTSTEASAFSKARLVIAPISTSGRYRIVGNGFRVLHETKDDILSRDGQGDEVYGAFTMFHYDRHTGTLLDRDLRRTSVIGDVTNHAGRIKGGSWSSAGGFRAGDAYPSGGDPSVQRAEPSRDGFPFLIWDGTLTNGQDAVIILPTIWEWDGGNTAYDQWFQRELADAHTIWTDVGVQEMLGGNQLGVVLPAGVPGAPGGVAAAAATGFQTMLLQVGAMFGITPFDRPLGMRNVGGFAVLPRRAVVITREIIETSLQRLAGAPASTADAATRAAAALNDLQRMVTDLGASGGSSTTAGTARAVNAGMPYGTIEIPLIDGQGPDLQGQYVMYIQVERIP